MQDAVIQTNDSVSSSFAARGNAPADFSRSDAGFHLHVLASGSKGNAAIIETRSTCLLVDCGISKTAFQSRCQEIAFDLTRIEAILVTHEHSDHTKGLGANLRGLRKLGCEPRLYTTAGTLRVSSELQKLQGDFPITTIAHDEQLRIGAIGIQCVPTSHDAADSVCFAFETTFDGHRDVLGYITDTGIFPAELIDLLADARLLALESNHDSDMLARGPYPAYLKSRVASNKGHLSNEQSDKALEGLLNNRLETIIGMHLSETNNRPVLAREGFSNILTRNDHSANTFTGYQGMPVSIG